MLFCSYLMDIFVRLIISVVWTNLLHSICILLGLLILCVILVRSHRITIMSIRMIIMDSNIGSTLDPVISNERMRILIVILMFRVKILMLLVDDLFICVSNLLMVIIVYGFCGMFSFNLGRVLMIVDINRHRVGVIVSIYRHRVIVDINRHRMVVNIYRHRVMVDFYWLSVVVDTNWRWMVINIDRSIAMVVLYYTLLVLIDMSRYRIIILDFHNRLDTAFNDHGDTAVYDHVAAVVNGHGDAVVNNSVAAVVNNHWAAVVNDHRATVVNGHGDAMVNDRIKFMFFAIKWKCLILNFGMMALRKLCLKLY